MSIKLTGARLREDCINFITTQSNASEETQKISEDDDYDDIEEEYDIQKRLSFVESLAMLAWQNKEMFFSGWRDSNDAANLWRSSN